jgi:hypothetical protein
MSAKKRYGIAAIVLLGLAFATLIQSFSWNQTSHYDLIRALDNGRTTIDAYQENTGDKAFYEGHWYSARAPGLALWSLPFYDGLKAAGAEHWALEAQAQRGDDEMVWLVGLWGNVLPGLLMLLLVGHLAERLAPGYGAASAVILGLGTLALPLSTLLFSHVFCAFLGFAAFALMFHERDAPPNPWLLGLAGLAIGYSGASEYPMLFVGIVLAAYLLSRRDSLTPGGVALRGGAYVLGALIGLAPLALYNHYAFHSVFHLAYSSIPRQQQGFFGIGLPSLRVAATLLLDSRGLLTLSPVLVMGAIGTWLLYKRTPGPPASEDPRASEQGLDGPASSGKRPPRPGPGRAEALVIAAICLLYVGYNSGYYLPFGGGFMGPRFLMTLLPFLALPIGIALKRHPGPTIALAGASVACMVIATITHPLVGYETETVVWGRLLREGFFQPTIATAYGLGRGWAGVWPFLLAAGAAVALAALATARTRISRRSLLFGVLALAVWCLFAVLAPTLLGIDHQGLLDIVKAGDNTALNLKLHNGSRYPLQALAPIAAVVGLIGLLAAHLAWGGRRTTSSA